MKLLWKMISCSKISCESKFLLSPHRVGLNTISAFLPKNASINCVVGFIHVSRYLMVLRLEVSFVISQNKNYEKMLL